MQATTAPQAPVPPGTQKPGAPGQIVVTIPGGAGIPVTVADVQALKAKRAELSDQLQSAASRRQRLSSSLSGKEGADRLGIEQRIGVLDKRIMQLESDIAETGRQLTMAPGALVASTHSASQFYGMDPDAVAALGAVFTIFVLAPLAFAAARLMWKRATSRPAGPAISADASRRLERLEQGMDAIAIEIERVSEGQRFVTRLLSDAHGNSAPVASQQLAQPISVGGDAESVRQVGE